MFTKIKNPVVEGAKTALLIRLGAWGDMIWASAVLRQLKQDGYHVTMHCSERGFQVVKHDPNIDRFWVVKDGELDAIGLDRFWDALGKSFDKVINLTGSIETRSLITPNTVDALSGTKMYDWPTAQRHAVCNMNYMDSTMEAAGYPEVKGATGELHFTAKEEAWGKKFRATYPGFLIVWSLGGSSAHKAYPYAEMVAETLLETYADIQIVTVGDDWCKLLEFVHPKALKRSGEFGIRKSLVLAKYADLVIGPESSVINAASCFDNVHKIVLLSHSSGENLTKYWKNTISLFQSVACYPCHKLHYTLDCPLVEEIKAPICMGKLPPDRLLEAVEQVYGQWKAKQTVGAI